MLLHDVCVRERMRVCVRACMCACVRACDRFCILTRHLPLHDVCLGPGPGLGRCISVGCLSEKERE